MAAPCCRQQHRAQVHGHKEKKRSLCCPYGPHSTVGMMHKRGIKYGDIWLFCCQVLLPQCCVLTTRGISLWGLTAKSP